MIEVIQIQYQKDQHLTPKMRVYDSPMTSSTVQQSMKLKNHESPITKLTNMTDFRNSYQQSRVDGGLNDRSNEIFVPRNASKYIEESFEKKSNREKEIEEIRRKYYEQSQQKNSRPVSQKYDRYEVYRGKQFKAEQEQQIYKLNDESKRRQSLYGGSRPLESVSQNRQIEYTPNSKSKVDQNVFNNKYQNVSSFSKTSGQAFRPQQQRDYGKQNLRPSMIEQEGKIQKNLHLDRISQASNSNYETLTKSNDAFSPQKNRVKSSFVVDDRSNKRTMNPSSSTFFYGENFKNKDNYKTIIKETASVYEQSARNSGNARLTSVSKCNEKDSVKQNRFESNVSKVESRVQPYEPKPFTIDEELKEVSRGQSKRAQLQSAQKSYPTIYDNYLPKSPAPFTNQKSTKRQQESSQRPRTMTDYKKVSSDRIKQIYEPTKTLQQQKNQIKRRVLNFGDDDRIKQIEKRLKQKEIEFKKKEESMKTRCEQNYQRRTQLSLNRMQNQISNKRNDSSYTPNKNVTQERSSSVRPNVDQEIERLSSKIRQFEDRKKQLNIRTKNFENTKTPQSKPQEDSVQRIPQPKDYENARKALEEYRQGSKQKNNSEVYQLSEYRIQSSANIEETGRLSKKDEEQIDSYRRQSGYMDKQKQPSRRCDFIENTRPMYSEKTLLESKYEATSRFGLQLFKIECEESEELSSCRSRNTTISTGSVNANQCRNQFEIYRRTDEGIQQRKKRLKQNKKEGSSQQLKRLVAALSQQSIYDEEFRNCKIWFHNQKEESKWQDLKQALKTYCEVKYTELRDGTVAEFHICEDENNPFFSVNQESKFTYQSLIRSYVTCKKYWQQNVQKKFEKNCLKAEGFTLEKFDLEKKGFINLEDFVRFLNFESGNFYRNRDLILIFKRFLNDRSEKQEKSLTLEKIFDVVSC